MQKSSSTIASVVTLLATVMGCTDATYGSADLPADWENASRIERFRQSGCGNSPASVGPAEAIDVAVTGGTVDIKYAYAPFRCQQAVEGFVRETGNVLDVLVQPVDMSPEQPTTCSCLYEFGLTLPARAGSYKAGEYTLTVHRRWDNVVTDNPLVPVSTQALAIE
jgi:hypothetical protein